MRQTTTIIALLFLFIAATGIAAAGAIVHTSPSDITLNVQNNEVKQVTYTVTGSDAYDVDVIVFKITAISPGASATDLKARWQPAGAYGQSGAMDCVPPGSSCTGTIDLTDNGDADDATQNGLEYLITFTAYNGTQPIDNTDISLGASTTFITAVPEFPTVALPIAAILGLVFLFNRRKQQ